MYISIYRIAHIRLGKPSIFRSFKEISQGKNISAQDLNNQKSPKINIKDNTRFSIDTERNHKRTIKLTYKLRKGSLPVQPINLENNNLNEEQPLRYPSTIKGKINSNDTNLYEAENTLKKKNKTIKLCKGIQSFKQSPNTSRTKEYANKLESEDKKGGENLINEMLTSRKNIENECNYKTNIFLNTERDNIKNVIHTHINNRDNNNRDNNKIITLTKRIAPNFCKRRRSGIALLIHSKNVNNSKIKKSFKEIKSLNQSSFTSKNFSKEHITNQYVVSNYNYKRESKSNKSIGFTEDSCNKKSLSKLRSPHDVIIRFNFDSLNLLNIKNNNNGILEVIDAIKKSWNESKCPPITTVSFYRIGKLLGKGAFGKVNLGIHKLSGKLVALKSITKKVMTDEHSKNKVLREVSIWGQLQHKSIIRLYESFESKKHILYVSELCSGGDLLTYVRKRRKLKEKVAKFILKHILDGLYYCHSKGILHRDIKLDNILLNSEGMIKVDFHYKIRLEILV